MTKYIASEDFRKDTSKYLEHAMEKETLVVVSKAGHPDAGMMSIGPAGSYGSMIVGNFRELFKNYAHPEGRMNFDYERAESMIGTGWIDAYTRSVGSPLFVIGTAANDHMTLFMDGDTKVYGCYDEEIFLIGENPGQAFENLLLNKIISQIPFKSEELDTWEKNAPWLVPNTCSKCKLTFYVSESLTGTNPGYQLICEECSPTED